MVPLKAVKLDTFANDACNRFEKFALVPCSPPSKVVLVPEPVIFKVPIEEVAANRLEVDAVVAKKFVEVADVVVARFANRFATFR